MSSVNYAVVRLDLATVRSDPGEAIVGVGVAYDAVTVLQLPAGAVISLAFGDNKPQVPLLTQGQTFAFMDACNRPYVVTETLRAVNPVGAGVVVLLVSFGGVRSEAV